ncbi:MAG: cadherin domain-containing protein [Candidatus Magnetomorum sp.]|nr:cadherin domain-containing protein [Candidatus Magnetomorum sp.]
MRTTANRMSFTDFQKSFIISFVIIFLGILNAASASTNAQPRFQTARLSIPFLVNQGQISDASVLFYAKTFAGTVMVHQNGDIIFQSTTSGQRFVERLDSTFQFIPLPGDLSQSKINMFYPHTIAAQKTSINAYHHIDMPDIYPNISMKLKAYGQTVEKIFIVNQGGNPNQIQMTVKGAQSLKTNDSGELEILPQGVRYSTPKAYQVIGNKQIPVEVRFRVCSNNISYGFHMGDYDTRYPLMIDPYIAGTFFGGDKRDEIEDVAIHSNGDVYVAGTTWSANIPVNAAATGATQTFDPTNHVHDIFVARFNSNLTQLLSATFIGGSEFDTARAIALDPDGNVFVTGQTTSADFPIPATPSFRRTYKAAGDGFVVRLNADLSTILSATYWGGTKEDMPEEMAIHSESKEIYITGYTRSSDFNTTESLSLRGLTDAFVSRFNNDLSQLLSSRYLGGDNEDKGFAIQINSFKNIILGGQTYSSDFPTTVNSYDQTPNGNMEAFLCEMNYDLSVVMAGTYLGGNRGDKVTAIVLDAENNIYATGTTSSENFPIIDAQSTYSSTLKGTDIFIAKFDKDLRSLTASTFMGGMEWENASAIILDGNKNIMIAGTTVSTDFPTTPGAYDLNYNGGHDIFISTFSPSLASLSVSTYMGSTADDAVAAIAIQNNANVVIVGTTWSTAFPVSTTAFDVSFNGGSGERDGFISILTQDLGGTLRIVSESDSIHVTMSEEGSPQDFSLTLSAENDLGGAINWQISTQAAHGTAVASGPGTSKSITYIPSTNWYGTDSFVIQINDDAQHIDRITVYVHVLPEPDYPVFKTPGRVYTVNENSPRDTIIGTIQATDPDNGNLIFSLISGNNDQAFDIIPSTGELLVKTDTAVDYEQYTLFTLSVAVANASYTKTETFYVALINQNDAPTMLNQQFIVVENSVVGTIVDTVVASDADQNDLYYRIISGNTNNTFSISSTTGKLAVADNSILNFEGEIKTFDIGIEVSDGTYTQTAIMTVGIANTNDKPVIADQLFTTDENKSTATFQIVATDPDEDNLTYTILSGNETKAFLIHADTGLIGIQNISLIDYETHPVYTLSVGVSDGGYTVVANIKISLNNMNDNPPVIDNQLFYVNENAPGGTTLGTVIAYDPDHLFLSYIIRKPIDSPFNINGTSGLLTVNSGNFLDCETTCAYTLTVQVSDGQYTSTGLVTVQLKDINESAPLLTKDTFSFKVNENSIAGTLVGQVTATDGDPNDILIYSIISGNTGNVFRMNEQTGKITVQVGANLDREKLRTYVLGIRVSDGTFSDTANAEVIINNINDNPPDVSNQTLYINENTKNGTIVGRVLYQDPDEDAQSFSILSGNTNFAFAIVDATGEIMVNDQTQLDYEYGIQSFVLTVKAFDGLFSDIGIIVINVKNTNDNVPIVAYQTFYVDENKRNNTWVGTVVANDEDPSDVLSYEIISGNTDSAFKIDAQTGKLSVNGDKKLNYENINHYELLIRISDGTNAVTSMVAIMINEKNDPPTVNDQIFAVEENRPDGTVVGTISAWDDDAGDVLVFSISAGNANNPFRIDSDGNLIIKDPGSLNYETLKTVDLVVTVSDGQYQAKASVKVNILDINDSPVIVNQTFSIDEDSINTSYVGTAVASDEDRPLNILTFNILSGNDDNAFVLHESTGVLRVNNTSVIDFEKQDQFVLTVQVDDGQARKDALMTINIRNTNDNRPQIDNLSVEIDENRPSGFEIGHVTASDADNDTLSYQIIKGNTNLVFAFPDTNSSTITVQFGNLLDYELVPEYQLIVQVSDGYYQNTATVSIKVNNLNDNIPLVQANTLNVNESADIGFNIGKIFAQDADDDELTYSIIQASPSNAFMVSETAGFLYVASDLDYENLPAYTLTVQVSDGTYQASAFIQVLIMNDNDNAPLVFDQTFTIKETALNGTSVGFFVARDFDKDPFSFSLTVPNDVFAINPANGAITVKEDTSLNNDVTPKYELSIKVTDGKYASYAIATILVIDGNDNRVVYDQSFSVLENSPKDTLFGTIAVDAPAGSRQFIIGSGNSNNAFFLDPDTGQLMVNNPDALNYEAIQSFHLSVLATVNGTVYQPVITIHVKDANEFAPVFESNNYHFYLDENSIGGTPVGTIHATDLDTADVLNYQLMSGVPYNPFIMGLNSGQLTVNGDYLLNYEFVSAYTLTVNVSDGKHFAETRVLVSLNDRNEFAPQFASETFEYTIAENIAAGSYIGQIEASDDDPGSLLIYRITAGNDQRIFQINDMGNLSIDDADGLDFESQPAYTLTVQISDGLFNDTAQVHIHVSNVNDAPEIILSLFPRIPTIQGGSLHSLVLNTSGTILSFGYNQHGQLGDDTMIDHLVPASIAGDHDSVKMDTRYYHSIALQNDGSVWTWGWNAKGQLGNGQTTDQFAPIQVTGLTRVSGISAGAHHSLALMSDGTVKAWGANTSGQLGDGTWEGRLRPVNVKGIEPVKAVFAGYYHSMAILHDDTVWAWGKNDAGQLGDGSYNIDKPTPVFVSGLVNVISVAGGKAHSMALKKNGTVWTWGHNGKGQLGIGSTENKYHPVQLDSLSDIIAIAAGGEHCMGLQDDGTVWVWGLNEQGQLGDGTKENRTRPIKLQSLETFIAIAAGERHSMALTTDGSVWAWGQNSKGQLGNNTITDALVPIKVSAPNNLEPLNIGQQQPPTITIDEDNKTEYIPFYIKDAETPVQELTVSGDADNPILVPNDQIAISCIDGDCQAMITPSQNDNGETMVYLRVSDGEKTATSQIKLIVLPLNDPPTISSIPNQRTDENIATGSIVFTINDLESAADNLILMARSSNPLLVPDDHIVFGGTGKNRFVTVMPGNNQSGTSVITLTVRDQTAAASTSFTLAVNAAPDITDIGDITIAEDESTGFIVFDVSDAESDFTQLTIVGFSSNTTLISDKNIMINCSSIGCTVMIIPNIDQSGKALITLRVTDGYAISEDTFQITVEPGNDPPSIEIDLTTGNPAISAGAYHSLAVRGGNEVMAWGRNDIGQLGIGTSGEGTDQAIPRIVNGLENIIDLAGGENHNLALSDNGNIWAWGNNSHGQLGIGVSGGGTEIDQPEKVLLLTDIIGIDAGYAHSLALQNNGTVWAWGSNTQGQLGTGKSGADTSEDTPNLIQTLDNCVSVAAGYGHSVALKKDGTVWTWGFNSSGQLGDGSETNRNQPAIVPGLANIIAIAAGDYHTVALKNDGTVWTWGDNPFGQLGDGTTIMKKTPVRVVDISNVTSIAAGYVHTLALRNDGTVWGWGGNVYGQLGDNTTEMRTRPVKADIFPKVIAVEAGHYHSLVLKSDGSVWSFGSNSFGQLGDSTLQGQMQPLQVHGLNNVGTLDIGTPYFISEDSQTGAILFSITDEETPSEYLIVTAASSNPRLVPETSITLEGSGKIRTITVRPAKNQFGKATITLTVSDGLSSTTESFTLWVNEINDAPLISDIGYQSIDEDTPSPQIPFTISDMETPADYLLVSASSSNTDLIPNGNIQISGTGSSRTIQVTPAENMYGIATITIEVSDGFAVVSDTFTVRVKDVNDPPDISDILDQITDEDTPTAPIQFVVSDMETPGSNLVVTASTSDPTKVAVSTILFGGSDQNRTVTLIPLPDQNGHVQITLHVSDGALTAQKSFDLYIAPVDDVPRISPISNQETFEYVTTLPISFTITDAETPPEDLILTGVSSDTLIVTNEGITFGGTGSQRTIIISPQENQFGTTDITIAISDGNNTIIETFSLTVNPQRDWDILDSIVTYSDLEDIWGRSANDIYAVGNSGAIFHYNGISWSKVVTTYDDDFNAIWGDVGMVYVVGNNGVVLQYNGYSWSKMFTGTTEHLYGVWGNGRSVFAVGTYGTILKYNGVSWTEMSSSTTTTLLDVWGNENKMYAAGNGGLVLQYNGYDWQPMTKITAYSLRGVWGSSENDVFVVGDGGTILHYDGTEWVEMERGKFSSLKGIWGLSGNKVFAAGLQGTIVSYNGTEWSETESGVVFPLMGLWGASITDIYVVGENGTILKRSTGQISGKIVTTITGGNAIVVGASVSIQETGQHTTTDTNGNYHFDNVPIGAYTVIVSSEYFQEMTLTDVRVPGGEVAIPDIELSDLKTGLYSQAELDNAVYKERIKYDPDADGVISVENIIFFLQWLTEIR